jgi:hypothetical protein
MRIVHLMLCSFYIDNANYQENCLPRQNKFDNHDVTIIASTEYFILGTNKTNFSLPLKYVNEDNIPVYRLQYRKILSKKLSTKLRIFIGLTELLNKLKPEIIFFHGIASYDLITVANFVKANPKTKFFVDSHSDTNNSAKNIISKYLLHKLIYKTFILFSLNKIDRIYYITIETKLFLNTIYNLKDSNLSYLPLGGFILSEFERLTIRNRLRKDLQISEDKIVLIHSGKMDSNKRTFEILSAFNKINSNKYILLLLGTMEEKVKNLCQPLIIENRNIRNIGWVTGRELQEFLLASDLYIQLGSQSVTMQNALCSNCAVAVYPYESHLSLLFDKVFYIKDENDVSSLLKDILVNPLTLEFKRKLSFEFAQSILDYKVIANAYLQESV